MSDWSREKMTDLPSEDQAASPEKFGIESITMRRETSYRRRSDLSFAPASVCSSRRRLSFFGFHDINMESSVRPSPSKSNRVSASPVAVEITLQGTGPWRNEPGDATYRHVAEKLPGGTFPFRPMKCSTGSYSSASYG